MAGWRHLLLLLSVRACVRGALVGYLGGGSERGCTVACVIVGTSLHVADRMKQGGENGGGTTPYYPGSMFGTYRTSELVHAI